MTKKNTLTYCCTVFLGLMLASPANAALYLMFNVGDNEDREVPDAGTTLAKALDGSPPASIDSNAERYFVPLPGATMNTLSGSATPIGGTPSTASTTGTAIQSVSESVMADAGPSSPNIDTGDTGWVEYESGAASLMYFSPDGLDQESDVRYEPARVFLRRFEDGTVVAMITGQNGAPPAD